MTLSFDTPAIWWIAAALLFVLAMVAGWADGHRQRWRRDRPGDVGLVPWRGLGAAAFFASILAIILATHVQP